MGIFQTEDRADRAAAHYGAEGNLAATITTLRRERDEAVAKLAAFEGRGITPLAGHFLITSTLGAATVQVEIEHQPESGDGIEEPFNPETFSAQRVLINGVFVAVFDCANDDQVERWESEAAGMIETGRKVGTAMSLAEVRRHQYTEGRRMEAPL